MRPRWGRLDLIAAEGLDEFADSENLFLLRKSGLRKSGACRLRRSPRGEVCCVVVWHFLFWLNASG